LRKRKERLERLRPFAMVATAEGIMRKAILGLLMALHATAASAGDERWLVIKSGDGAYGYDQGSLVDKGSGHFTFSTGLYIPDAATVSSITYNYMLTDSELNCSDGTYTTSAFYLFDDNAKMLDMRESKGNWNSTKDNGVMEILARIICSHRTIDGAIEAGDMDQAMKTMRGFFK
jgi:hypothetical protein